MSHCIYVLWHVIKSSLTVWEIALVLFLTHLFIQCKILQACSSKLKLLLSFQQSEVVNLVSVSNLGWFLCPSVVQPDGLCLRFTASQALEWRGSRSPLKKKTCHSEIQNKHVATDTNRYRFWEVTGRQFTTQGQHGKIALKTTSTSTKTRHYTMKQLIWRITGWKGWRTKKIEEQNKITENSPGCCGVSSCPSSVDSAVSGVAALHLPAAAVGHRPRQSSSKSPGPRPMHNHHLLLQSSLTLEMDQVTRSRAAKNLVWETRDALMLLYTTHALTHTEIPKDASSEEDF